MGAVFFLTFLPVIFIVLGIIVTLAIVGTVILVIGVGGSIVSASALTNKRTKEASLFFFVSLLALGLSCLAVLGGVFSTLYFIIAPTLTIVGAAVVTLGIAGIIRSFKIDHKPAKIVFATLLSISAVMGAIVFSIGALIILAT